MEAGRVGARGASGRWLADEGGQSTVEYLLVLSAFLVAVVVMGLLWHAGRDGALVGEATRAASHGTAQGGVALLKDVLCY